MDYPIKVLYVYGDTLRLGGIERVMLNYFRGMDKNVIHIDFALQGDEETIFEKEIRGAGSEIYRLPKPGKHLVRYCRRLSQILSKGGYQIVHGHCDAMNYRVMLISKVIGVPVRIAHSHNTSHILGSRTRYAYYEHCRKRIGRYATACWACSDAAGKWLFGQYPYQVFPNAIPLEQFAFDPQKRAEMRRRLGIGEDEIVLGHVGRFHYQKNHAFFLPLMEALAQSGRKYRLLLVGGGEMQESIQNAAISRGLQDRLIFTGFVTAPEDYYPAMDAFLLPSLFEGYPVVLPEAEANGLLCFVSDRVTQEFNVAERVKYLPLETSVWRRAIAECPSFERKDMRETMIKCGLELHALTRRVQDEYVRLWQAAK